MNEIITIRQNRHAGAGRYPETIGFNMHKHHWITACAGMTALNFFVFMFLYAVFIRLSIRTSTLRRIVTFFVGQLRNEITHKLRPVPLIDHMELTPVNLVVRK